MITPIPTAYPEPFRPKATTTWRVFESLWRAYKRGETLPGKAGILPETVADAEDITERTVRTRLNTLEAEGVVVRMDALDPTTIQHRVTWAPAALVDHPRKSHVPGGLLR